MLTTLPSVLICIPTYNESENIIEILQRLEKAMTALSDSYRWQILVIDDNSPDGTAELVAKSNFSNVQILRREKKAGLGPAYLAGFSWGVDRNFDLFVECDADGSHQPEELVHLLRAASGSDLVIGTRWMPGGEVVNWPLSRRLISRIGTTYAQIVLRLPYKDLTGGYRVLTNNCLKKVDYLKVESLGYGFQIEMAMRAHDAGLSIAQVPITFIERTQGQSKMSKKIVLEALLQTTKWGLQRLSGS